MGDRKQYGSPSTFEAEEGRRARQLNSIRSSLSYRLGNLLVSSVLRPWMILVLPFTVPSLLWRYGRERIGWEKMQNGIEENSFKSKSRDCAILFPTNGVGMGHYSRMFALAMALKRKRPEMEIVFFTTNFVIHPVYREGLITYHLPSRNKFEKMDAGTWNEICEEMLANVFSIHRPSLFVFDGAYPYRGMLNSIKGENETLKIWVRRASKRGKGSVPVDSFEHFEKIVIPDDLIEQEIEEINEWPIDEVILSPPLLSVSAEDLSPPGELRSRLGVPEDGVVALVSLGAGKINNIRVTMDQVVNGLAKRGIYVIIADSMLNPIDKRFENPMVRVVQDFPIMRHRSCFDFAVIAGGYNSVNESILLELPTVIIPNKETSRDDQEERGSRSAEMGYSIVVEESDERMIELALDRICDEIVRGEMIDNFKENQTKDGCDILAKRLISELY